MSFLSQSTAPQSALNFDWPIDPPTFWTLMRGVWDAAILWWGWPALPLLLAGLALLRRDVKRSPALTIALTWLASAVVFVLVETAAGLSVRYHLFVLPALALVAGWALWRLWRWRPYAGAALSLLLGGLLFAAAPAYATQTCSITSCPWP